jgi:serine/threonine protein kinase
MLGAGGMGEVYRARDPRIGREVAIKILASRVGPERLRRFADEARAVGALNHPNILAVYDVSLEGEVPFVVFELLEGETLRQRLANRSLPLRKVVDYATQIARGLAAAHQKGIVHRDLKPENLFVATAGHVKILDFGLSKLRAESPSDVDAEAATVSQRTDPGTVLGTVGYMSPEQVRGEATDARSDIFAFGAILYEMLSGRRAFQGGSSVETLNAILKDEPAELPRAEREVPPALERIVRRCLEKSPDERFRSAHDLAFALDAISDLPPSGWQLPAPAGIKLNSRRWPLAALVVLLAIALLGEGLRLWLGRGRESARRSASAIQVERLTSRGDVGEASISPDGRYLAYVSSGERATMWLRDLVEKNEARLASTPPEGEYLSILRFAADGHAIYYSFAHRGTDDHSLYRVPLIGGEPHLVHAGGWGFNLSFDDKRLAFWRYRKGGGDSVYVADTESGEEKLIADGGSTFAWSPDGSQMLFARDRKTLFVVRSDGTGERKLWVAPQPLRDAWWKPGGDRVLCTVELNGRDRQLFDVELATANARQLGTATWGQINDVRWLPEGSGFTVQGWIKGQDHTLWLVSYPDGVAHRLPDDSNRYWSLGMTTDGTKLVSVQSVERSELLVSGNPERVSFQRIKSSTGDNYTLCWTSDRKLVYSSREGGSYDLYVSDPDGSNRKLLTQDKTHDEIEPSASPDGRYIVFASNRSGEWGLFRMNSDGSGLAALTPAPEIYHADRDPHVTPDSRWVLYRHRDNGSTLWRVPIEGGRATLVKGVRPSLPDGLVEEAFGGGASPDGKLVAFLYFTMDTKGGYSPVDLVVSEPDGKIVKRLPYRHSSLGMISDNEHVQWSKDGSALHYVDLEGPHDLWKQPLSGGPRVRLAHLDEPPSYCKWSFDDKAIACARSWMLRDVVLITNFH